MCGPKGLMVHRDFMYELSRDEADAMVENSVHRHQEQRGPQAEEMEESWVAGWHDLSDLKGDLARTDWRTHARISCAGRLSMDTRNGPAYSIRPSRGWTAAMLPYTTYSWTAAIASHPDNLSLSWAQMNSSELQFTMKNRTFGKA